MRALGMGSGWVLWGESLKGCAWDDLGWREVGAWADQGGGVRRPRWVWGCTKLGTWAHQDGCEGVPRWVRGHTKLGVGAYQDWYVGTPRWV